MRRYKQTSHKQKFSNQKNAKPVRKIPLLLKVRIIFSNVPFFIGFMFFLIGSIFLIVFGSFIAFDDLKFSKNDPITKGKILNSRYTNSSINEQTVIEYEYEFYTPDGKRHLGKSYTVNQLQDSVDIVYLKDEPTISKIYNTTKGGFPFWIIFFLLIFPATGIIIAFFGLRKTIKWLDILKIGKIAFGIYHRREATGASVNDMRVYKLYFKYSVDNKEYEAVGETHKTYNLHNEQYEPLLYNPYNPNEAIMVDALPRQVRKILSTEIEKAKSNSNNMIGF